MTMYATPMKAERLELGLSLCVLEALTGISVSLLSRFERGEYSLPYEKERRVRNTLGSVRRLVSVLPFRPDLRDARSLKQALVDLEAGRLSGLTVEHRAGA